MTADYHDLAPLPTGGVIQRPSCVSQASRAGGASGTRLADESDDDSDCLPHQSRAGDASGTAPPSSHLHTAPSSHLAIFTPRIFTPHLGTVRAHHGAPPPPPSHLFTRAHSQTRLSFTPGGRWSIRAPTQPKKITFAARDSELAPHLISAIWRISDTELYREGLNAPHVRCVTTAEMERVVAGAPPFLLLYVHP